MFNKFTFILYTLSCAIRLHQSYQLAVHYVDILSGVLSTVTSWQCMLWTLCLMSSLQLLRPVDTESFCSVHSYQVAVKARDVAGLESQVVQSAAILVDVTPPESVTCTGFLLRGQTTLSPTPTRSVLHDTYVADVMAGSGEVTSVEVTAAGVEDSAVGSLHVAELKMPLHFRFSPWGVATANHSFLSPYSGDLRVHILVEAQPGAAITAKLYQCSRTVASSEQSVTIRQMSQNVVSVCALIRDRESGIQSMLVGVGTTEGGLQGRTWTAVGHSGHVNIDAHVQHATLLYATVVSQNQAGEWSRFTSQPITFDRTGPLVSNVTLTLRYEGDDQVESTKVWAEASWTAADTESGEGQCTCRLGKTR